ncbi:hypothetical protein D3C86_628630 [compost metagenome]
MVPITKLNAAIPIGYHSPDKGVDPEKLAIKVAIKGTSPPKTPLPMWYGKDIEVYLILVGKSSTKNAAIGP